jgi:hypothetical protein
LFSATIHDPRSAIRNPQSAIRNPLCVPANGRVWYNARAGKPDVEYGVSNGFVRKRNV